MLYIAKQLFLPEKEIELTAVRSQGAGGQNVNKVSTAIHLRFDIRTSSLPDFCKNRLLKKADQRISKDGVLVIKAQTFRTQEKNREDALRRLREIIGSCLVVPKKRKPTRPTKSSQEKRLAKKGKRAQVKDLRGKVRGDE